MTQNQVPKFRYQFLDATKYPLGNSREPHPWLMFETDSLDAFTTIYPRTTKESFLEGQPSDLPAPGHGHDCSINKNGYQYLRDCVQAIPSADFIPLSLRKKGCSGESEKIKRETLACLSDLALGRGKHLAQTTCPIGSIVSVSPTDVSPAVSGVVIDHWAKMGGTGVPVVLLALVTEYPDDSAGYLVRDKNPSQSRYIYPGIQFLAFARTVKLQGETVVDSPLLHRWPACFEVEKVKIAARLGLDYEPARTNSRRNSRLGQEMAALAEATRLPSKHQSSRPSVTPAVAIRTLTTRDMSAALMANTIAASSPSDKGEYLRAIKEAKPSVREDANTDSYLSRRTTLSLPMTSQLFPLIRNQAQQDDQSEDLAVEFISSNPGRPDPEWILKVEQHLRTAYSANNEIDFLTFVSISGSVEILTSVWQVGGKTIELVHTNYMEQLKA